MPECHKCPHAARVDSGAFRNVPWQKTPCYGCRWTGDQQQHHGASHISIDAVSESAKRDDESLPAAMGAITMFMAEIAAADDQYRDARSSHAPRHQARKRDWARRIECLLTLSQLQYIKLRVEHPGIQDREIAHMMGCTPQNVSALRKNMIRRIHDHSDFVGEIMAYYRKRR